VRPLYKFVHSLHHRNTDIEPFAGLCMHPIEHLYYFACIAPSLYVFASPFAFMWNGVHLLISPAASHSGYEDHFQADQFHYLHHKHFECNYGPGDCPLDRWFGTFKDKTLNSGRADGGQDVDDVAAVTHDAKADITGQPDPSYAYYIATAVLLPLAALVGAMRDPASLAAWAAGPLSGAQAVALLCSVGPVAAGLLGLLLFDAKALRRPRFSLTAPFHKEGLLGALGFHLLVGGAVTVLPVYHMVHMVLAPPGESAYCMLHGC